MLTQLATVKARLGIPPAQTKDDVTLTGFINLVSNRFDAHCNRKFEREEGATYDFCASDREIIPLRLPIESVTGFAVQSSAREGWVTMEDVDYFIRAAGEAPTIISLAAALGPEASLARLTYTGGYVLPGATPSAGQTALPSDLEVACQEQVCFLYQSKDRLGLGSVQGAGGSIQTFPQIDLLPSVKQVLRFYERWAN